MWLCSFGTTFVSCRDMLFICVRVIQTSKIFVNMLHNWCYRYSSYNSNFKCVGLTIKCIGSKPIHYVINLDIVFILYDF